MAKKESEMSCTTCSATYSAVWRKDKELKHRICNRCYLTKYPQRAPPKKAETPSGPETKKRKLELVTSPVEDPVVKKEKKEDVEEMKTEEVKSEVKDEVKEELKEEVKKEVQDESNAEGKKEKKEKKSKKHDKEDMNDLVPDQAPEVSVDSDTEYQEVDLEKTPSGLIVESSSNSKIDGKYKRLPQSSRGRPAYWMSRPDKEGKDRTMYLYFCQKSWKISSKFGIAKSHASLKEVEGVIDPCEPYPHPWRVYRKEDEQHHTVLAMRVYSQEAAAEQSKLPEPPLEASALSSSGGAGLSPEELAERKKLKAEKKKAKEEKANEKEEKAKEAADRPASSDGKAEGAEDAAKKDAEASSSEESSSSEEESEEEEESSSSDSDGPSASPAKAQVSEEEAKQKKAGEFEQRLRSQLEGFVKKKDAKGLHNQFQQIQNKIKEKSGSLIQVAGLTPEKAEELLETLRRDYQLEKKTNARLPKAPPPAHLLKGAKASAPGPPAPTTPPESSGSGAPSAESMTMPHRTHQPTKSVLRPWYQGPRRKRPGPALSLAMGQEAPVQQVFIQSFRDLGEKLWYTMPGSSVVCDSCGNTVPQQMGSLQGAMGHSQFAQNRFICTECSGPST